MKIEIPPVVATRLIYCRDNDILGKVFHDPETMKFVMYSDFWEEWLQPRSVEIVRLRFRRSDWLTFKAIAQRYSISTSRASEIYRLGLKKIVANMLRYLPEEVRLPDNPGDLKLFEVKVLEFERRCGLGEYKLDGVADHPRRYRYVKCWQYPQGNDWLTPVGGKGVFPFADGYCDWFMGKLGWVIEEIDPSRAMEPDRLEFAEYLSIEKELS